MGRSGEKGGSADGRAACALTAACRPALSAMAGFLVVPRLAPALQPQRAAGFEAGSRRLPPKAPCLLTFCSDLVCRSS